MEILVAVDAAEDADAFFSVAADVDGGVLFAELDIAYGAGEQFLGPTEAFVHYGDECLDA